MERRPAPPVTVVVPSRSGGAGEVLAQAEPEAGPEPGRPARWRRGARLLVAVLALVAASLAVEQRERPAPRVAPDPLDPVRASSQLLFEDPLRVRLLVEVRITGAPPAGPPDSRPSSAQVMLQGLSSPGLVLRLPGRPLPVPLGSLAPRGTRLEQVVRLTVDAVALGCAEPQRPRRLELEVSRGAGGSGSSGTVAVRDRAEVTQALEGLVRRSCGGAVGR